MKELCDHEHMDVIEDVFAAYQNCYDEKNGILRAKMQCAEVPDETQLAQIRNYLAGKYQKTQVELEFEKKAGTDRRIRAPRGRHRRGFQYQGTA